MQVMGFADEKHLLPMGKIFLFLRGDLAYG